MKKRNPIYTAGSFLLAGALTLSMAACRWCARASCWATLAGRRTGSGLGGGGVSARVTLRP